MVFFIISGVCLIGGIVLMFVWQNAKKKLEAITGTDTVRVSDVIDNHKYFKEKFGDNAFSQYVELKGTAQCDAPLMGELSGQPCVYYSAKVMRHYEVQVTRRDNEGRTSTHWESRTDTVSSNERGIEFRLHDESGRIPVFGDGSSKELVKTVDRFEQGESPSLSGFILSALSGARTIGFEYQEFAIPVGAPIYLLGDANDRTGTLKVSMPQEKGKVFLMSTKSEEQLVKKHGSSSTWSLAGGIVLFVAAVVLAVIGLTSM